MLNPADYNNVYISDISFLDLYMYKLYLASNNLPYIPDNTFKSSVNYVLGLKNLIVEYQLF